MEGRRWNDLRDALSGVAQSCGQFDSDGFDLYFLNNEYAQHGITVSGMNDCTIRLLIDHSFNRTVKQSHVSSKKLVQTVCDLSSLFYYLCTLIIPLGATPTGARLKKVLENYFPRIEEKTRPSKPVGIVVITDGESDPCGC